MTMTLLSTSQGSTLRPPNVNPTQRPDNGDWPRLSVTVTDTKKRRKGETVTMIARRNVMIAIAALRIYAAASPSGAAVPRDPGL